MLFWPRDLPCRPCWPGRTVYMSFWPDDLGPVYLIGWHGQRNLTCWPDLLTWPADLTWQARPPTRPADLLGWIEMITACWLVRLIDWKKTPRDGTFSIIGLFSIEYKVTLFFKGFWDQIVLNRPDLTSTVYGRLKKWQTYEERWMLVAIYKNKKNCGLWTSDS
jgi:hypothetical protein